MVKVKVCGITTPDDAEMVYRAGVDMMGVIVDVSVSTPREIDTDMARKVLEALPNGVETVVVTMPDALEDACELSEDLDPDYLQIHSDLPPSFLRELGRETGTKIIRVFAVPERAQDVIKLIDKAKEVAKASDILLLDTKGASGGGTGEVHDWSVSSKICKAVKVPVILAGGLNPSNVQKAVGRVNPFGVDVASGVETKPGRKDRKMVDKFVNEAGG